MTQPPAGHRPTLTPPRLPRPPAPPAPPRQLHADLDRAQAALARIRALHHPTGVVAAAEHGNPPDCAVCGDNCWPCPTYNAATEPEPAATQATKPAGCTNQETR